MNKKNNFTSVTLANELIDWLKCDYNFWLKDFANYKGLTFSNMKNIIQNDPYALDTLSIAIEIMESKIVESTLKGLGGKDFAKFVLKNILDWKDKKEIQQDFSNLPDITYIRTPDSKIKINGNIENDKSAESV